METSKKHTLTHKHQAQKALDSMNKDEEDHSRNKNEESKLSRAMSSMFGIGSEEKAAASSQMLNRSMVYNSNSG